MKNYYLVAVFDYYDNLISTRAFDSREAARMFAYEINKDSPYYARYLTPEELEEIDDKGYLN